MGNACISSEVGAMTEGWQVTLLPDDEPLDTQLDP